MDGETGLTITTTTDRLLGRQAGRDAQGTVRVEDAEGAGCLRRGVGGVAAGHDVLGDDGRHVAAAVGALFGGGRGRGGWFSWLVYVLIMPFILENCYWMDVFSHNDGDVVLSGTEMGLLLFSE